MSAKDQIWHFHSAPLQSRVYARDDKNLPNKDQLIISGTHLLGNNWNMGRFNELPSSNKLVTLKVLVRSDDLNEFLNLQIVVK